MAQGNSQFTVRGHVIDRGQQTGIAQATVRLGDNPSVITGADGSFIIPGVHPGPFSLTVEALGYHTVYTTMRVSDDISITIRMDPEPIPIQGLNVQPSLFKLRGHVLETGANRGASYLKVRLPNGTETLTRDDGSFTLGGLARGTHQLAVEGFGWLPLHVEVDMESDTSIELHAQRDPITEIVIQQQVAKLSSRIRSEAKPLRVVERDAFLDSRAATPINVLVERAGVRVVVCPGNHLPYCIMGHSGGIAEPMIYIDDRVIPCGAAVLAGYPNGAIERIEVLDHGSIIRAYTRWFIEDMAAGREVAQPIPPYDHAFKCTT